MIHKPSHKLTFHDRMSHLTFHQACKLLAPWGRDLIQQGAKRDADLKEDVYLGGDLLRVKFAGLGDEPAAIATLTLKSDEKDRLHWHCTACQEPCEHVGALLSTVLENKTALGLAAAPPEPQPVAELSEEELVARAIAERAERARTERMKVRRTDESRPWTDYLVTSAVSGKTYRVALRGLAAGESYCSCPDFRTNTLGTCKHIIKVISLAKRKFSPRQLARPYRSRRLAVHLRYDREITLRLAAPPDPPRAVEKVIAPLRDGPITDVLGLLARLQKLEALEQDVHVHPDAEELIQQWLHRERIRGRVEEIRWNPAGTRCGPACSRSPCFPTSSMASPSPWGPTTWVWARPSRASVSPNCWRARRGSARCSWSVPPR